MAKLYKLTTLEDTFGCNFNVLIDGAPRQLGVAGILTEWIRFRVGCLKRELTYELGKKRDKMHLLRALGKILLDIDKAIVIVRVTQRESDDVPRLMDGFSIDQMQAEYIAEIKLRHLNREYIIERIKEIESLGKEIHDLEETIADELKIKALIIEQLRDVKKKFGKPRKTQLIYADDIIEEAEIDPTENYNIRVVLTKDGYFKKTTYQSLRGADEQKLKDGDEIINSEDTENIAELMFISDKCRAYKAKADDFEPVKASSLGDFLPAKLGFDDGERPIMMKSMKDGYNKDHHIIYIFENGKGVRVPVSAYDTKGTRRRLTGAYSDASPVVAAIYEEKPMNLMLMASDGRGIYINSSLIPEKTTRSASGVILMSLKKGQTVTEVHAGEKADAYPGAAKYKKTKIPSPGVLPRTAPEQMSLVDDE